MITELPTELLNQIFDTVEIEYDERCQTFASLARVCHQFQVISTPLLYRDFQDCCPRHLQLFARTISSIPDRAQHVRHYKGHEHEFRPRKRCPYTWNVFAVDEALLGAVQKRNIDLSSAVTRATFSMSIVSVCPNLQRLEMKNGGNSLMRLLRSQTDNGKLHAIVPFDRLRTLSITIGPDRDYQVYDMSLLFQLPSINALTIGLATLNSKEELGEGFGDALWQCQRHSSTIEELILEQCALPVTWITSMIGSCRVLKHFHHEHYYRDTSVEYYAQLFEALTAHKESLVYLRINELMGCRGTYTGEALFVEPFRLQSFWSLTYLDLPLFSLSTRTKTLQIEELLPRSLEVLTVDVSSVRDGPSDPFFISVAEATQRHLPLLKSIEVICRIEVYRPQGYLPVHPCHLQRMFASCGVELIYFVEFINCEFGAGKRTSISFPTDGT
jgi:hypothetical protein